MTTQVSEYEKQANELLQKMNVTFSVQLLGNDCPKFCEDARKSHAMGELNTFPRNTHIHGKHYLAVFTRIKTSGQKYRTLSVTIDFWNSYNDEEHNWAISNEGRRSIMSFACPVALEKLVKGHRKDMTRHEPTAYDVLACLTKYHPGTFEDFCSEFGYDTDSRSAFQTYEAVLMEWGKVSAFFSAEEIEQLQEVQ